MRIVDRDTVSVLSLQAGQCVESQGDGGKDDEENRDDSHNL